MEKEDWAWRLNIDSVAATNQTTTQSIGKTAHRSGDASIHIKAQIIQEIVERVSFESVRHYVLNAEA